jgi:hypothetical protein
MRLKKEHYQMYMDFFVSKIDGENYGRELITEEEKVKFVYDCFVNEKVRQDRRGDCRNDFLRPELSHQVS